MQAHRFRPAGGNFSSHRVGLEFGIAVVDGDTGTLARQPQSDGAANTATGPGYQCHLALEWFPCQDAPSFRQRAGRFPALPVVNILC